MRMEDRYADKEAQEACCEEEDRYETPRPSKEGDEEDRGKTAGRCKEGRAAQPQGRCAQEGGEAAVHAHARAGTSDLARARNGW